jgi:hypothetical protein
VSFISNFYSSVDNYKLKPAAANGLIKGIADILSSMPHDKIQVCHILFFNADNANSHMRSVNDKNIGSLYMRYLFSIF